MTISEARDLYRALRDRALAVSPSEASYINALWKTWDSALAGMGAGTKLPSWFGSWYPTTLAWARDDTVVEWMDAFPSAVEEAVNQAAVPT